MNLNIEHFKIFYEKIKAVEEKDFTSDILKIANDYLNHGIMTENNIPQIIFIKIANHIVFLRFMCNLCVDVKRNEDFISQKITTVDCIEDFHQLFFEDSKKCHRKLIDLRASVLEATKNWTIERKLKDIKNPIIGSFYKSWYV